MATLLIAEHDNKSLNGVTHKALTAATAIGGPVHVLVAGKGCAAAAPSCGCNAAAPTCGCNAGTPAEVKGADAAPIPPAPVVDPSAFLPTQRRVVHASASLVR